MKIQEKPQDNTDIQAYRERIMADIKPSRQYASYVFSEVVKGDCYKLRQMTDNNYDYVLDIGANIGTFSMYANGFFPNSKFIAFEPVPSTYNCAKYILDTHFKGDIDVRNYGVGEKTELADIFIRSEKFSGDFSIGRPMGDSNRQITEKAQIYSVEDFVDRLPQMNNYYVKMDIEESEIVFFKSQKGIDFLRNAKTVVMEVHYFEHKKEDVLNMVYDCFGKDVVVKRSLPNCSYVLYDRK